MSKCIEKNAKLSNIKKKDNIAAVKQTTKKSTNSINKSPSTSSKTSLEDESSDNTYNSSQGDSSDDCEQEYSQVFESDEDSDADMELLSEALEKTTMKRQNKTFSDHKIREIERGNSVLMKKLVSNSNRSSQYTATPTITTKLSSSAINRKKKQTQIDRDNLILLRKLRNVKPAVQHKQI